MHAQKPPSQFTLGLDTTELPCQSWFLTRCKGAKASSLADALTKYHDYRIYKNWFECLEIGFSTTSTSLSCLSFHSTPYYMYIPTCSYMYMCMHSKPELFMYIMVVYYNLKPESIIKWITKNLLNYHVRWFDYMHR